MHQGQERRDNERPLCPTLCAVPLHKIPENMQKQLEWCSEAPFYTLGPASDGHCARLRSHHGVCA